VQFPFLSTVENSWDSISKPHALTLRQQVVSGKSSGQLTIAIETNEARAEIKASEALKALDISVSRFKDARVIASGPCNSDADVESRLRKLVIDLTTSPFA